MSVVGFFLRTCINLLIFSLVVSKYFVVNLLLITNEKMLSLPQMNWQRIWLVCVKEYNLKWYIMTLILNCKALHPERMNSPRTGAKGETEVKLRTWQ